MDQRREAKFHLLSNLMRRNISAFEFQRWYRLIDWIMKLPPEVNREVWLRLESLKEVNTVSHVTFAETYYREKGLTQGLKDGLTNSLQDLLTAKFVDEGAALFDSFKDEQNVDRLKSLVRAAGLAVSLDDFRNRVSSISQEE